MLFYFNKIIHDFNAQSLKIFLKKTFSIGNLKFLSLHKITKN